MRNRMYASVDRRPSWRERRGDRPLAGRVWIGLAFLGLGIVWTLDNLRLLDSDRVFEWWPLLLVGFGVTRLVSGGGATRPLAPYVFIGLGGWLLAHNLGYAPWGFSELWPLCLIAFGALIVVRALRAPQTPAAFQSPAGATGLGAAGTSSAAAGAAAAQDTHGLSGSVAAGDTFSGWATWSSVERMCTSQALRGGDFTAIMGGGAIDVRAAKPVPGGAVVDLTVVMGGVEIVVPDDWQVLNEIQCIMGGVEDNRTPAPANGTSILRLKGFVMMGGVEILNHRKG